MIFFVQLYKRKKMDTHCTTTTSSLLNKVLSAPWADECIGSFSSCNVNWDWSVFSLVWAVLLMTYHHHRKIMVLAFHANFHSMAKRLNCLASLQMDWFQFYFQKSKLLVHFNKKNGKIATYIRYVWMVLYFWYAKFENDNFGSDKFNLL